MHHKMSGVLFRFALRPTAWLVLLGAFSLFGCGPADEGDATSSDAVADSVTTDSATTDSATTDGAKTDGAPSTDGAPKADSGVTPMPTPMPPVPMPPAPAPADAAKLIEQAGAGEPAARIEAIDELGKLRAEGAVDVLTKALADQNSEVRTHAALALASIGSAAAKSAASLVAALSHEDAKTRAYAAVALGRIGDKSQATVEAIVDKALDPDPLVRRAVLGALHQLKPPRDITIPRMAKALEDAEPSAVAPALHTMAAMGADGVPALIEALNHEKAAYWACLILSEIAKHDAAGEKTQDAVDALLKAASSPDPEIRMHALLALAEFGPAAKTAAAKAAEALAGDEFDGARYAAAYALGTFGDAEVGIAPLETAAASDDALLKLLAVQGLARLKPTDEAVVRLAASEMAQALASEDATLRAAAARGLAEFGGSSEITAPALERAVADAKPEVIANAISAFVAQGATIVPRVVNGLKNEKLRHYAVRILIRIGPDAKEAVPALIEALKQDDGKDLPFRAELQFALGSIGSTSAEAVPELIESLASTDEQVRNSACFALRHIGPAAAEAAPMLKKNVAGSDRFLAMASVWALLEIEPDDQELVQSAVPLLIAGLSHENERVRIESARALGELGPAAKGAVEHLEGVEGSPELNTVVDEALQKIKG